jgi:hypothetical protein
MYAAFEDKPMYLHSLCGDSGQDVLPVHCLGQGHPCNEVIVVVIRLLS